MPTDTPTLIALTALVLAGLALLLGLWLVVRVRRLGRRPASLPVAGADVGPLIAQHARQLDDLARALTEVHGRLSPLEEQARHSVQHVGLVRYNPFDDTGGQQSFALALLDAAFDGVVISSLHSRQQTRIYLKEISGGRCDGQLSAEESEALKRAGAAH